MTAASLRRIAAIVVNYGTAELAVAAVESLLAHAHGGRDVEVHLLDNGSPGDDAATIAQAHAARGWGTRVTLYPERENHGFGRGNNVVLRALLDRSDPPDAAFLLNPDARLDNEAVDLLARDLETHPRAGFAGAGVTRPDTGPVTAAFRFPSAAAEFAQALGFGPVSRVLGARQVPLPPDHPAGEVDWVTGAAFLVRMETLREIGLFDPDFFLYYEEVEIMWRARRAGWSSRYVPGARIIHVEGAATDVRSVREVPKRHPPYRYASWRLYHLKTAGRAGAAWAAAATLAGAAGGHVIARLRGRADAGVPHFLGDFWTHAARPLLFGDPRAGGTDGR